MSAAIAFSEREADEGRVGGFCKCDGGGRGREAREELVEFVYVWVCAGVNGFGVPAVANEKQVSLRRLLLGSSSSDEYEDGPETEVSIGEEHRSLSSIEG